MTILSKKKFNIFSKSIINYMLYAVIIIEIISIAYINFTVQPYLIDKDFAKLAKHAIEMVENHSIFLTDWYNISTLELDCATLPALFFYFLSRNILNSYAFANMLNVAFVIILIWQLLKHTKIKECYRLLAIASILCIYDYGMLQYTNMMFYCGSQYIYKTTIPLLYLLVSTLGYEHFKKRDIIWIAIYAVLYFITILSSGIYVFLCGILPVMICQLVFFSSGKDHQNPRNATLLGGGTIFLTIVAELIVALHKIEFCNPAPQIIDTDVPAENIVSAFNDIINIINPFYNAGIKAVSIGGIAVCLKIIAVIYLLSGLLSLNKVFGIAIYRNDSHELTDETRIESSLISIFIWNFFILYLTGSVSRYHLIGVIPLMLVSAISLARFLDNYSDKLKKMLIGGLGVCYVLISLFNITKGLENYYQIWNWYYIIDKSEIEYLQSLFEKYDTDYMYMVDYDELIEVLRLYDTEHNYELYVANDHSVTNIDYYYTNMDRAFAPSKNLIVCKQSDLEKLPYWILDNYTEVETIGTCSVLYSESNPNDGISYIRKGIKTIDLATTPGYEVSGTIDANGYLHAKSINNDDTNIVLSSSEMTIYDDMSVTINYECDKEGSIINQYKNGQLDQSIEMKPSENKAIFQIDETGTYKYEIVCQGTTELTIKEIEFE